jgi:hypothetical protein
VELHSPREPLEMASASPLSLGYVTPQLSRGRRADKDAHRARSRQPSLSPGPGEYLCA